MVKQSQIVLNIDTNPANTAATISNMNKNSHNKNGQL